MGCAQNASLCAVEKGIGLQQSTPNALYVGGGETRKNLDRRKKQTDMGSRAERPRSAVPQEVFMVTSTRPSRAISVAERAQSFFVLWCRILWRGNRVVHLFLASAQNISKTHFCWELHYCGLKRKCVFVLEVFVCQP